MTHDPADQRKCEACRRPMPRSIMICALCGHNHRNGSRSQEAARHITLMFRHALWESEVIEALSTPPPGWDRSIADILDNPDRDWALYLTRPTEEPRQ